jgi:hypothetical protein
MIINLKLSGHFDLKAIRNFALVPQTWLVNPVIDQRTNGYCISMISKWKQMQNSKGVLSWTTKIKRKKAIGLQQKRAVTMS